MSRRERERKLKNGRKNSTRRKIKKKEKGTVAAVALQRRGELGRERDRAGPAEMDTENRHYKLTSLIDGGPSAKGMAVAADRK